MRCSLRGHSGGCGRGSLDAVPLPLIRAADPHRQCRRPERGLDSKQPPIGASGAGDAAHLSASAQR